MAPVSVIKKTVSELGNNEGSWKRGFKFHLMMSTNILSENEATSSTSGWENEIVVVPFSRPKAYEVTNGVYPIWKKCYS